MNRDSALTMLIETPSAVWLDTLAVMLIVALVVMLAITGVLLVMPMEEDWSEGERRTH